VFRQQQRREQQLLTPHPPPSEPEPAPTITDIDLEALTEVAGFKLFIGQIPKDLSEEDIFPVFTAFGPILELQVRTKGGRAER